METVIVAVVLAVIIGFAVRYIYKARKSGVKCIGCPDGRSCGSCGCGCGGHCDAK